MYLDIEEDAVNIAESIALEAAKAAKHVLFTTIAQSITKPTIPSINELNIEIKKLGSSDGRYVNNETIYFNSALTSRVPQLTPPSHLLNISLLLNHWNNPSHPQTYSLTSHRVSQHIGFYENKWDNEEKLGLYHLSEQTKNILPDDSDFDFCLEKTAKPVALYRPFLTQGCAQFVHLQGQLAPIRVELDFRCAQNMAKIGGGFNHLQGVKINNTALTVGIAHPPSIISQAFQKLNTALRGIPDIPITTPAPTNRVGYTPGLSQLKYPGINAFRPSRVMAASYVASLTSGLEVEPRMMGEEMLMGWDGVCRPATINGMWRLELIRDRSLQVVNINNLASAQVLEKPFRKGRGRIIGEVVEPPPEPSKRTHSAASEAAEDEGEDEVLVAESSPEPSSNKRAHSAAFPAAEDEDEDDVPMARRRQRLRHDAVILGEAIIRERPARVGERPSRAGREPSIKYVKRRGGGEKGPGRGWRKTKGRK